MITTKSTSTIGLESCNPIISLKPKKQIQLKGLNIRIGYVIAKMRDQIMGVSGAGIEVTNATVDYYVDARVIGYMDFNEGIFNPPIMFHDEPFLLTAWKEGQQDALSDPV